MQKECVFPAPPFLNREYKPNGHREQLPQHMTASCESNVRDGVHSKLRRSYRREAISQEKHVMLEGDYLIFCCDGNVMDNTESSVLRRKTPPQGLALKFDSVASRMGAQASEPYHYFDASLTEAMSTFATEKTQGE